MMKRKLTKKEWKMVWVTVAIAVFVAANVAIKHTHTTFSRLDKEIKLAEAQLARLYTIVNRKEELESEYEKMNTKIRPIKDSDSFLQEIENIARGIGLNIQDIKPTATKDEIFYKVFSVEMQAQDEIVTLAKLLHAFAEDVKSISVERLQINSQSQKETPKVSLLINAVGFNE